MPACRLGAPALAGAARRHGQRRCGRGCTAGCSQAARAAPLVRILHASIVDRASRADDESLPLTGCLCL
eukprot:2839810-Prymnesium_polylepis.1